MLDLCSSLSRLSRFKNKKYIHLKERLLLDIGRPFNSPICAAEILKVGYIPRK